MQYCLCPRVPKFVDVHPSSGPGSPWSTLCRSQIIFDFPGSVHSSGFGPGSQASASTTNVGLCPYVNALR